MLKTTKRSKLNTKVNNLEKKIPDATNLIHINQYNTDKKVWKKRDLDKKIPEVSGLVTTTVLNARIGDVEKRKPDNSSLVTPTVFDTKIGEVRNKILGVSGLVKKTDYSDKITDIEKIFFITYNKFTKKIYLKQR